MRRTQAKWKMISEGIASRIILGNLKPGDKIPTDMELAHQYRCSVGTAHQAMYHLKAQGITYTATTIGRFVTEDAPRICKEKGY